MIVDSLDYCRVHIGAVSHNYTGYGQPANKAGWYFPALRKQFAVGVGYIGAADPGLSIASMLSRVSSDAIRANDHAVYDHTAVQESIEIRQGEKKAEELSGVLPP